MQTALSAASETAENPYNLAFWLAYVANVFVVAANALTFRFAELVQHLGGSEAVAGAIVSIGGIGALLARFWLGQAIDRHGASRLWILSSGLFLGGLLLILMEQSITPLLYIGRSLYAMGLAGMFTCSLVHIQHGVPAARRTELIASLGSSGFVGMIIGSQLGDFIYYNAPEGYVSHQALFGTSFCLGLAYLAMVVFLTRRDRHIAPQETPAIHRLVFRYWPGMIVLVGLTMGVGFTTTTVFLTRFATEQGLRGVGTFFTSYAVTAFIFRVMSRRWSDTVGQHRMVQLGLAGQCLGYGMLAFVTQEWQFIPPAILVGFGHALLFPVVVSVGSGVFPPTYRGTGTTLVLGSTEFGALISAPLLGSLIETFKADYGYYPLFLLASLTASVVGILYSLTAARRPVPTWQPAGGAALQNCPACPRRD